MWMDGLYIHSGVSELIEPDEFIVEHTKTFDNYEHHTLFDFLLSTGLFFDGGGEAPNYVIKFGESENAYTISYDHRENSVYNKDWLDFESEYTTKKTENGLTEWGIKIIVAEPNIPLVLSSQSPYDNREYIVLDKQLDDNIYLRCEVHGSLSMVYISNGTINHETDGYFKSAVHLQEYRDLYDASTIVECDTILAPFTAYPENEKVTEVLETSIFKNRMIACHDFYFKGRMVDHVIDAEYQDLFNLKNWHYTRKCIKMNDMFFYIFSDNPSIGYANAGGKKCFIEHNFECVRIR